jgi:hypothetical protein
MSGTPRGYRVTRADTGLALVTWTALTARQRGRKFGRVGKNAQTKTASIELGAEGRRRAQRLGKRSPKRTAPRWLGHMRAHHLARLALAVEIACERW